MYEKLSEKDKRHKKVSEFKANLINDIENYRRKSFEVFCKCFIEGIESIETGKNFADEMHILNVLEDYLSEPNSFMRWHKIDQNADVIIYYVSMETIDLLLVEKHLLRNIIFKALESGSPAEMVFNDEYFEHGFLSPLERVLLKEKLKQEKADNKEVKENQVCVHVER